MNRRTLSFIAMAFSIMYGVGFALFDNAPRWYSIGGACLVGIAWIAVGMLGRRDEAVERR